MDTRASALWPSRGQVSRSSEHVMACGRVMTRTLQVVLCGLDPIAELERLVEAPPDLAIVVDDRGLIAKAPGFVACINGDPRLGSYELHVDLESEHDVIDLRSDIERYRAFDPIAAIAELGLRVIRVGCTQVRNRAPHLAFSIAVDDESRLGLVAWLTAQEFTRHGPTWERGDHVVTFERADELGVDEVTAFVYPSGRRRAFAHGTDAIGVAVPEIEVSPAQIIAERDSAPAITR